SRRGSGAGEPIGRDDVQHLVVAEPRLALGIRPRPVPQLLHDPRTLPDRRIGQRIADGLRARALNLVIALPAGAEALLALPTGELMWRGVVAVPRLAS